MGGVIKLSIIIPTCGRPSLYETLYSILHAGIEDTDEVIVVGDGMQAESRRIISCFESRLPVVYYETASTRCVGHFQRTYGMSVAHGTHLMFIDDDDAYVHEALKKARLVATYYPGKIIMFRMKGVSKRIPYNVLWSEPVLKFGNVGTPMWVVPNITSKMGRWEERRGGDYEFIRGTVEKFGPGSVVWREEIIAEIR
jgi:glycosyltransferase involved in cell wall biosynthesis